MHNNLEYQKFIEAVRSLFECEFKNINSTIVQKPKSSEEDKRLDRVQKSIKHKKLYLMKYAYDNFGITFDQFDRIVEEYDEDDLIMKTDFSTIEIQYKKSCKSSQSIEVNKPELPVTNVVNVTVANEESKTKITKRKRKTVNQNE